LLKKTLQRCVYALALLAEIRLIGPDLIGKKPSLPPRKNISMSLHTYGRHINYTGRSEFDLEHKCEKPYVLKVAVDQHARA